MKTNKIYNQDCLIGMKEMVSESVDLIVSDPPYGYSFMGKDWDKAVPSVEIWKQCLRVLKPGAFAFIMSAPRQDVQSQMIVRLSDVGFNVSFTPLYWAYASGFPKASNIGKMVDKRLGAEREVIGKSPNWRPSTVGTHITDGGYKTFEYKPLTKSATPQAKALDGSYGGFQPKPAVEIILVAMKPLSEKTYVDQALKNNKGITWLDDVRVPYESNDKPNIDRSHFKITEEGKYEISSEQEWRHNAGLNYQANTQGRFPANLLVSDNVLDDGSVSKSTKTSSLGGFGISNNDYGDNSKDIDYERGHNDSGTFSRYFDLDKWHINKLPNNAKRTFPFLITPKASSGEKNEGLDGFEEKKRTIRWKGAEGDDWNNIEMSMKNIHPTTKPLKLMSYLITLGSRENDIVLDPFIGSGTTAISARQLTRQFIGFELNEEYHKIAEGRLRDCMEQKKLFESIQTQQNTKHH